MVAVTTTPMDNAPYNAKLIRPSLLTLFAFVQRRVLPIGLALPVCQGATRVVRTRISDAICHTSRIVWVLCLPLKAVVTTHRGAIANSIVCLEDLRFFMLIVGAMGAGTLTTMMTKNVSGVTRHAALPPPTTAALS